MGEYSSAEILIGGQIRKGQVRALCKAIREQGVATDWGAAPFQPRTGEDLLAACQVRDEVLLLQLCDDQASGGQFGRLRARRADLLRAQKDGECQVCAGRLLIRAQYAAGR